MTKKVQTPETDIMVESKTKIESFFDKYGSKVMWGLVAVSVIAVGIFFFINRSEKKEAAQNAAARQAATALVYQNTNMMTGETSLDIDYAATAESYMAIANEYPETASGNMCYFLAASNYLYAGDLANAKAALAKLQNVEGDLGAHINAMALTLAGDIAVEENDYQTAAAKFEKALAASKNVDIYGDNTLKLGLVYEAMGDEAKAQATYKKAVETYPELKAVFANYIKE
jgi:tetratricopeptide (TPR) repeat protein